VSDWIRVGPGEPWHRVSRLEAMNAFGALEAGAFRLMCGETVPAIGGWEQALPELVPQDDQHPPCEHRAKREAYWWQRFREAPMQPSPWMVRDLVREIDPRLENVQIVMDPRDDGPQRLRLRARNLAPTIEASGPSMNQAIGELLAMVEPDMEPAN
jgi:hypothetical protein